MNCKDCDKGMSMEINNHYGSEVHTCECGTTCVVDTTGVISDDIGKVWWNNDYWYEIDKNLIESKKRNGVNHSRIEDETGELLYTIDGMEYSYGDAVDYLVCECGMDTEEADRYLEGMECIEDSSPAPAGKLCKE